MARRLLGAARRAEDPDLGVLAAAVGAPRSLLRSPRRRRRLALAGGLLAAAGALAAVGVLGSNTGRSLDTPQRDEPAVLPARAPRRAPISTPSLADAADVGARFIRRAVLGVERGDTWSLVAPEYRAGFTRAAWRRGERPVIPYRGRLDRMALMASYADRVELAVRLLPPRGSGDGPLRMVLELRDAAPGAARRWLVASWAPPATLTPAPPAETRRILRPPPPKEGLTAAWLLLPLALVGGGLAVVAALAARGGWRSRRARRAYERSRLARAPSPDVPPEAHDRRRLHASRRSATGGREAAE